MVAQISALLRLPPGARLAYIGAGTGNYTNALAETGFQVSAIEPSAAMRAQATAHTNAVWFEGAAEALPLHDNSMDGIVSTLAIHHFTSVPRAVPGGGAIGRRGLLRWGSGEGTRVTFLGLGPNKTWPHKQVAWKTEPIDNGHALITWRPLRT